MAKIVILDDTRKVRQLVCESLSLAGHDVRTTSVSAEAIDLAHLFEPDLLIADWDLQSDYDGFEVAEAFQAANAKIRTIVMSERRSIQKAFSASTQATPGSNLGIVASLAKPLSLTTLTQTVNQALASTQQVYSLLADRRKFRV